jgi:hypothetical protein
VWSFDHLDVVDQLAWLAIYGDPPPPNEHTPIARGEFKA